MLNPPNRNFQGVLLPNSSAPKFDTLFPAGNRGQGTQKNYNNNGNNLLTYIGGFRFPTSNFGDSNTYFARGRIALNPSNNSIFVAGHNQHRAVGEFSIPETLSTTTDWNQLPQATNLQPFKTLTAEFSVAGLYVSNGKLLVNYYKNYDQGGDAQLINTTYVVDDASDLANSTIVGPLEIEGRQYAAGWVAEIPSEWQARLGHEWIGGWTSSTTRAGVHVSSVGPSAFGIDYNELFSDPAAVIPPVNSTAYAWYNLANPLEDDMYNGDLTNRWYTHYSEANYGFIIPNSNLYMVFGRTGGHQFGMTYGEPPYGGAKGHYTIAQEDKGAAYWLCSLDDFEDVRNGLKTHHEVEPIDIGFIEPRFTLSRPDFEHVILGGAYDSTNNRLYLTFGGLGSNGEIAVAVYNVDQNPNINLT